MATFLDLAGLEGFSQIFVFVLVLLGVYIALVMIKAFSDQKWIAMVIALVVAIFVVLVPMLVGILKTIIPWFAVLFIFVLFITVSSKIFGASDMDFDSMKTPLLIVVVLIFVVGTAIYIRQQTDVPGDLDKDGNIIKEKNYNELGSFLLHPTVVGVIFVLLVGIFTVSLLAGKSS